MQPTSDCFFNFEHWTALAKADPQGFEARRAEEIAALIARGSPQNQARLRGLQWQIDTVRSRAKNPLAACVRIFDQMWESVYGERGLLETLQAVDGTPLAERTPGEIVELDLPHRAQRHDTLIRPS